MVRSPRLRLRLRQLCFRVHQFLGALVGGYWILMAATGAVLLYGEELERRVHPRWFALADVGEPLPLSRLVEPVAARFPRTPVEDVRLPRNPGDCVLFLLPDPDGGSTREVFVHPQTGAILGHRLESESWLSLVYRLHADLLLRGPGQTANGLLALAAAALLATAIPLWMPRGRSQWKQRLAVNLRGGRMRALFDLHNAFGIVSLPVLTTVALTGIFFLYASQIEPVVLALAGTSPAPEHAPVASRAPALPVDRLRARAESAAPQARTTWVNLPTAPGKPFRITRAYVGAEGVGHTAEVSVDPGDGRILGVTSARGEPVGRRVVRWVYPLHTGSWGGVLSKPLYLAGACAPIALMVTGIAKWRLRNRRKSARRDGGTDPAERPILSPCASSSSAGPASSAAPASATPSPSDTTSSS